MPLPEGPTLWLAFLMEKKGLVQGVPIREFYVPGE